MLGHKLLENQNDTVDNQRKVNMEIWGYLAAIIMGLILGMIGGGGSILTVPILVYLFSIDPLQATSYSLFVVGLTAMVGGYSYFKKGEVDLKTGFIFAAPSFLGVYLTRLYIVPAIPDPVFSIGSIVLKKALLIMMVFSVLMVFASFSMIKNKKELSRKKADHLFGKIILVLQGFAVGCVTGFVGVGGGFLIIPALVVLVGMPLKLAVGTSLVIIATNSLFGFVGTLKHPEQVHWQLLLMVSVMAIGGLFVGMRFSKKIPEKTLKKGFGYFVLVMGTLILLDQIKKIM